jgi:hypothetical protein
MNFSRLPRLAALAAATLLLIGAETKAASITLPTTANNLQGNSFVLGDKTFSFTQVTATNTTLTNIQVNPLSPLGTTQAAAVQPFGFQLAGSVVSAAPGTTSDLLLNFTVTSSDGPITAVTLFSTGGGASGGAGIISETLVNGLTGLPDGSFSVSNSTPSPITFTLPTPTTVLIVSKDINAVAGATGTASYSDVRNTFIQGVPEPASMVMLGTGVVGIFGLSLLRKKNKV